MILYEVGAHRNQMDVDLCDLSLKFSDHSLPNPLLPVSIFSLEAATLGLLSFLSSINLWNVGAFCYPF